MPMLSKAKTRSLPGMGGDEPDSSPLSLHFSKLGEERQVVKEGFF